MLTRKDSPRSEVQVQAGAGAVTGAGGDDVDNVGEADGAEVDGGVSALVEGAVQDRKLILKLRTDQACAAREQHSDGCQVDHASPGD